MRRLRLSFPDNRQQDRRIEMALLLIGLFVLIIVFFQFKQVSEAVSYWNIRVERLEQQRKPKVTHRNRSSARNRGREIGQEIRKEIIKANAILGQINLPWETVFNSVEQAINEDVALLTMQPNVGSQALRIGGEARDMAVLLDFVEALEREPIFKNVHLLSYKIKQDTPHRPINFQLTATWIESI